MGKQELKIAKENENKIVLDEEAIKSVEKELQKLADELNGKTYIITEDNEIKKGLLNFMMNDAKWTGLECAGVKEIVNNIKKQKTKKTVLDAVGTEAMFWFMKNHTSTGYDSATEFVKLLKPVSEALQRMQHDKHEFDTLKFKLETLKNGVDPDAPEKTLKGIN